MRVLFTVMVFALILLGCQPTPPTPQPTATLVPTATPFSVTFPTPLPTATPYTIPSPPSTATPVRFPTPLPTATPIVFPTALPTATPMLFPTPLPTSTPMPTATPQTFTTRYVTATPTRTPRPTATPRPRATRTPTPTPRPVASRPAATPAPHGHTLSGNWLVIRGNTIELKAAIRQGSFSGNEPAHLIIQCTGSGRDLLYVLWDEDFEEIVSAFSQHRTIVSVDGNIKIERWRVVNQNSLRSPDIERTLGQMEGGRQIFVETTIGDENRWAVFYLAGLREALRQIYPCER